MSKPSLKVALEACRFEITDACAKHGMTPTAAALDKLDESALNRLSISALMSVSGLADDSIRQSAMQLAAKIVIEKLSLTHLILAIIEDKSADEIFNQLFAALDLHSKPTGAVVGTPAAGDAVGDAVVGIPTHRDTTPEKYVTGSMINSSGGLHTEMHFLKKELDPLRFDLTDFFDRLFDAPLGLIREMAREAFTQFSNGPHPKYDVGANTWVQWPRDMRENQVRRWLLGLTSDLVVFLEEYNARSESQLPLRQIISPDLHVSSSTTLLDTSSNQLNHSNVCKRKVDAAFVRASLSSPPKRWDQIIVPIELKKNVADDPSIVFFDLAKYITKIFSNQPTRLFVLGLTLCAEKLRVWHVNRSGALGSCVIDVNQNPEDLLFVLLSFHCMTSKALGFDRTMQYSKEGRLYVDVPGKRRFFLLDCITLPRGIVSRATTIWKGYFDGSDQICVLKQSWQPDERNEGELLDRAAHRHLENVANMSDYWIVKDADSGSLDLDTERGLRKGIEIRRGSFHVQRQTQTYHLVTVTHPGLFGSSSTSGFKRTSGQASSEEPSSKRHKQEPPMPVRRVLTRLILTTVGKPIYLAESPAMLLKYFIQCIEGHKQLFKAGILHRDISINNLMINEDTSRPIKLAFLIDLDHAIWINRTSPSGLQCRTGTRCFMSCRILKGEAKHYLEDDLESFFWVLFWIATHYDGPSTARIISEHESWHILTDEALGTYKWGLLNSPQSLSTQLKHLSEFYFPLFDCLQRFGDVLVKGMKDPHHNLDMYRRVLDILNECLNRLPPHAM